MNLSPQSERRAAAKVPATRNETFEAIGILNELETLLREEQQAVAAYDVVALERLNLAKEDAARRLAGARVEALEPFRAAAHRVATLAETNAALLAASAAAVADALGVRAGVQTYDSRARLNQRMNIQCVRVL
jgi:flagellar biosynthesis/type III secretory pathway chaperone